jgi:glycosyltransferase involved in cell wall biosynthesis
MNTLISICIPTYRRPALLREALESCLRQTYADFEILIGDDSPDDDSALVASEYAARLPGRMHYRHNTPSLGQAPNVNALFQRARGGRLVLLHDDDLLLPDALEQLARCWHTAPELAAAFGKQYITDAHGRVCEEKSIALNETYCRTPERSGLQAVPAIAGLLRMFPNNGYMVRTDLAREIGYRSREFVGEACDTDFGLRLCLQARQVWFVDVFTSMYRDSDDAISKQVYLQPYAWDMMKNADVPEAALGAQRIALKSVAVGAASGFARLDKPGRALGVLLSPHYALRHKLHPRAAYHLYLIARAFLRVGLRPRQTLRTGTAA